MRKIKTASVRYCVDCVHCANDTDNYATCGFPKRKIDLVTGQPETLFCRIERCEDGPDRCGPTGRWFEPAPKIGVALSSKVIETSRAVLGKSMKLAPPKHHSIEKTALHSVLPPKRRGKDDRADRCNEKAWDFEG